MPLASGARLGPYEILGFLGAGAMGEVYRARDTRLGRDVAVKVLNPSLAADEASHTRFEREARAVAALNHPNIIALYDVGREGATAYVVTELLDGVTLRERLTDGPLPLRKAIEYARQMAAALGSAHERGIVHRDLKPENLVVTTTGRIKVLDFGLAHMAPAAAPAASPSDETTVQTTPGTVFGTFGYMAPEQARAQRVDSRSDIFAIGVILYEMISGRRAFARDTPADSLAALLHADPPPLPAAVEHSSPHLERIVRRCLEKSPDERFQSASDLAFALDLPGLEESAAAGTGLPPRARRFRFAAAAAAAIVLISAGALLAVALRWREDPATPPAMVRFGIPATMTWSDAASISPDGQYLVYTSGATAGRRFWLRRLDAMTATPLADTQEAVPMFFWSPDGKRLGYRSGTSLIVRDIPDGQRRVLAELPGTPQGVAWNDRDQLVIALASGLYVMPASGGEPRLIMKTTPEREVWRGGSPSFLPGGDRFLFTVLNNGSGENALETRVGTLDGRDLGTIGHGISGAMYADGHLLFGAGSSLYAQRFDPDSLVLSGDRRLLAESVSQDWRSGRLVAAVSATGTLVFRSAPMGDVEFSVVDRAGRVIRTIGAPGSYTNFSVSPDESRVVTSLRDPLSGRTSLWLIDAARGVTSLVTDPNDTRDSDDPTWSHDGRDIAYRHGGELVMRAANGGPPRTIVASEAYPDDVSRDGRYLIYGQPKGNGFQQWLLDLLTPGARPTPMVEGVTLADESRISPNGKWVAYHSNETGTAQVYVMTLPRSGQKWQISPQGGVQPRWSRDGNELFYLNPDGHLMTVALPGSDPQRAAAPQMLFNTGLQPSDAIDQIAPLTHGFLLRRPRPGASEPEAVQVIVNWKPR